MRSGRGTCKPASSGARKGLREGSRDPLGREMTSIGRLPGRYRRPPSALCAMADGDSVRTSLAEGAGRWDGVEALADGRILRRRRLAIPLAMSNRVELWTTPQRR